MVSYHHTKKPATEWPGCQLISQNASHISIVRTKAHRMQNQQLQRKSHKKHVRFHTQKKTIKFSDMAKGHGGSRAKDSAGNSNKTVGSHQSRGGAPKQTQAQINHARECNANSSAFWQTRGLSVPDTNRVDAAKSLASTQK